MVTRALQLIEQSRFELAEQELSKVLASDPEHYYAHAYLGYCRMRLDRYDEASKSIRTAIGLNPDEPLGHYFMGFCFADQKQYKDAISSAQEALRLDPTDSSYYRLLSSIYLQVQRWEKALEMAEEGLKLDPTDVGCKNSRATALNKLGRREEAYETIKDALRDDPEESDTFANLGWTYLHQGKHKEAMENFKEALKLEPDNEWARNGMVHALKAKYLVYRLLLRFYLWMSTLPQKVRLGVIVGIYIGIRLLRAVSKSNPKLLPYLSPVFIVYLLFVYLNWTGTQFFNSVLRLNKFGRLVLSNKERMESNWYACMFVGGVVCVVTALIIDNVTLVLIGAFLLVMTLPVCHLFNVSEKTINRRGLFFCVGLAALGISGIVINAFGMKEIAGGIGGLFGISFVIFTWTGAIISTRKEEI